MKESEKESSLIDKLPVKEMVRKAVYEKIGKFMKSEIMERKFNRHSTGSFRDYRYQVEVSLKGLKFRSQLLNYAIVVLKILWSA